MPRSNPPPAVSRSAPAAGRAVVAGILTLGLGLAAFAIWFQWRQTRRCLDFYGADAARAIQSAPRVELWSLAVDPGTGRLIAKERRDISSARGLVHLRRGLVEDANFAWGAAASESIRPTEWDDAIAFFSAARAEPAAVVAFDLDGAGAATVVGRRGRVSLGRMRSGLAEWIDSTRADRP